MKNFFSRRLSLFAFLACVLLGGVLTRHFGESWDELQFYKYADRAHASYAAWIQSGEIITTGNTYDNYGPAFVIFTSSLARALRALNPNWLITDLRHFIYFITFLAGIWAFHALAKRWMTQLAALAAALLFVAQPLFFGHAFISPKDIPFMSLFLLSISFGLRMADSVKPVSFDSPTPSVKKNLSLLTALWLASVIGLFAATDLIHSALANLVQSAADGEPNIISLLASDIRTAAPEIYVQKFFVLFLQIRAIYFYLFTCLLVYLFYRHIPSAFRLLPSVLPAAILLGVTTSIRILGPLAGLIVTYYALRNKGKQVIPALAIYAILAVITMYATWPYLWPNPPARLVESFQVMSQYPWKGQVLFNGAYYASNNLPISYLPYLLLIQSTEPIWPLFVIGLFALRRNNFALISTLLWFIIPLIALIATRAPLYDNTRQIFFILPPVFLVAGLGVDSVLKRVSRPTVRAGIVALLLLPGLCAGVRLHPYEYVYYNSLVNNPTGKFELDYWAVSYREAANWLNRNAPANAEVLAIGPAQIAENYVRDDITVISETDSANKNPDYVIVVARYNWEKELYPDAEAAHEIKRDGMVFAVIKKLQR
ncbi:MAG: hypothetical protein HZB19_15410 [Chloroflexi bacterium]|nr:hypothetical protein [Chloroflexota bacterium]